jgi:hypothetical protein
MFTQTLKDSPAKLAGANYHQADLRERPTLILSSRNGHGADADGTYPDTDSSPRSSAAAYGLLEQG